MPLLSPFAVAGSQTISVPDIAAAAGKAVVSIETLDGAGRRVSSGTGWVAEESGTIVTNYHVIAGGASLKVTLSSGESFDRVYIVSLDQPRDLALLRISAGRLTTLPIGDDDAVRVGDKVYTMGNPLGLDRTFSDGIVSSRRLLRGTQLLQITAPISRGSSGGPVMNAGGEVVGVAASQMRDGQNLNLAIPSRYVRALLDGPRETLLYSQTVAPDNAARATRSDATRPKAGADRWEATARSELLEWMASMSDEYVQSHELVTGALEEGQSEEIEFILRRGKLYAVIGTCDEDCNDIDLGVLDAQRRLIGSDVKDTDHPVVVVTAVNTATFFMRVLMAKCSVEPCRYAVGVVTPGKLDEGPPTRASVDRIKVDGIELGNRINSDRTVRENRREFGVRDTIYVSVFTVGSGMGTLRARWTYEDGQTVSQSSMEIAPTRNATHEFHVEKATPWPRGNYKVEIFLNGVRAATRHFTVN